jgi:hypothetical protein
MLFSTKFMVDEIFFSIEGKRKTITIDFLDFIQGKSMARQGKQALGNAILFFGRLHRIAKHFHVFPLPD